MMRRKTQRSENKKSFRMVCSERTRWGILGAGILLAAAGGLFLLQNRKPVEEKQENTLYSYQVTADSSYRVHLLPNELFSEEWLPEGRAYAEKLTDYIEITLKSELIGSEKAWISGNYQIAAVIEGYQSGGETRKVVYEKSFPLNEGEIPRTETNQAVVEDTVQVDLGSYRSQVDQAEMVLGGSTSRELTVRLDGEFLVETGEKTDKKSFSYRLPVSLGTGNSFFSIDKPKAALEEGKITESVSVLAGPAAGAMTFGAAAVIAGLAVMIFSRVGTRLPGEEERWRMDLSNIMRKYGSRMVRLQALPKLEGKELVYLESMENMILMAEEIRQPVFYSLDEDGMPAEGSFCVPDGERIYILQRKRPSTTLVVDESEKSSSQDGT